MLIDMGPVCNDASLVMGSSRLFEVREERIVGTRPLEQLVELLIENQLIAYEPDGDLNAAFQAGLLRRPGSERWEAQSDERQRKLEPITDQVLALLKELGFVDAENPAGKRKVDELVVLGARVERMRTRVHQSLALAKADQLEFTSVNLQSGNRKLTESEQSLFPSDPPSIECEALSLIWKANSDFEASLTSSSTIGASWNGNMGVRPTTESPLNEWAPSFEGSSVAVVVEKPYTRLADQIRWSLHKNGKQVEVIGYHPSSETSSLQTYLDEVARNVYAVTQRLKDGGK